MNIAYDPDLSIRDATKSRRVIDSPWYQDRWGSRFQMLRDRDRLDNYENSSGGFRLATSIGGKITGEGADCFAAGTLISTPRGPVAIEHIATGDTVFSMDLSQGKVVTCEVQATRTRSSSDIWKITTTGGDSVRCTGDHRIYAPGRGYVAAQSLGLGSRLALFRGGLPANPTNPRLMRRLQEADQQAALRRAEGAEDELRQPLLQQGMSEQPLRYQRPEAVSSLRQYWGQVWARQEILLQRMCSSCQNAKAQDTYLSGVRSIISWVDTALHPLLCRLISFQTNAWSQQLALSPAGQVFESVPPDGTSYQRAGQGALRGMLAARQESFNWPAVAVLPPNPPHGREHQAQWAGEPRDVVRGVSQETPSWDTRTVERVARDSRGSECVYDIQVAGCHNFFANGILAHNCIIIDDPINARKASWESARQDVNQFWDESLPTRLNSPKEGAFIIIMQRLHEDDLVGHILDKSDYNQDDIVHLNLPMEYDQNLDTRTYVMGELFFEDPREEPEELLWPERFPRDVVDRLKTTLGPFASSAQLQQQPAPRGGGIIDRMWWKLWDWEAYTQSQGADAGEDDGILRYPACELIIGSVDTRYGSSPGEKKEEQENAFDAMTVFGVFNDKRHRVNAVMMEAWRGRLKLRAIYPDDCVTDEERKPHWGLAEKIADTVRRRHISILLIENKTRGGDLAEELRRLLRDLDVSIVLLEPEGNKAARLYAVQPMFADGRVWAPNKAWAEAVITEVSQFPKGKFKDFVDTVSMALAWLRKAGVLLLGTEADQEYIEEQVFRPRKKAVYDV